MSESKLGIVKSLNWEVEEAQVMVKDNVAIRYKAIIRSDNHKILNLCKKSYTALTNEKFTDTVFRLSEFSGFPVDKFVEFKGGKVVLAFLKNKENLPIAEWDSEDYIVLGNSHDSSHGFFCGTSNVLIRCMNAFSSISKMNTIYHTKSINNKVDDLVLYYKYYMDEKEKMNNNFKRWSDIRVPIEVLDKFPEQLLDANENSKGLKKSQVAGLSASIAREITAMGDTYFGLFNGVTHYTTHVREPKYKMFGNTLGTDADINKKAFKLINELVPN